MYISSSITGCLSVKKISRERSGRAFHKYAHYAAAQKLLIRHFIVTGRKQLEEEEIDVNSYFMLPWYYAIETSGLDDKAGIRVSTP